MLEITGQLFLTADSGFSVELDPEGQTGLVFLRSKDKKVTIGFAVLDMPNVISLLEDACSLAETIESCQKSMNA